MLKLSTPIKSIWQGASNWIRNFPLTYPVKWFVECTMSMVAQPIQMILFCSSFADRKTSIKKFWASRESICSTSLVEKRIRGKIMTFFNFFLIAKIPRSQMTNFGFTLATLITNFAFTNTYLIFSLCFGSSWVTCASVFLFCYCIVSSITESIVEWNQLQLH